MSIYRVWIPGEKGYKEHLDRIYIAQDHIDAIREQSDQYKAEIRLQTAQQMASYNDNTQSLIASNEQIIPAIDRGFDRIAEINERGFQQVTTAIEDFHSDMTYLLGVIIQKLEYQNTLLNGILTTLQKPIETKITEYYNQGCSFVRQGLLDRAIKYFKTSIEDFDMGEDYFPSHYQLGLLYLNGKEDSVNVVDPKTATEYFNKANILGNGIVKVNPSFKLHLSNCKFYFSQSFYCQLKGDSNPSELGLVNNAIKYCEESVELNPNLSQGFYHLAKYYSYRIKLFPTYRNEEEIEKLLIYFMKAVEIDRNYLRAVIQKDKLMYDKILEPVKDDVLNLINRLTDIKRKDATMLLNKAHNYIALLDKKNTSQSSKYANEFSELKNIVQLSEKDMFTNTYFGFDDCIKKLEHL